jgi:hypothetical protein
MITVLLVSSIVAFLLFLVSVILLVRVVRRIVTLETVFVDTIEDIEAAIVVFDTLVNRRSLLSDDPDIQKIKQVFAIILDVLGDYIKNGKEATRGSPSKTKNK